MTELDLNGLLANPTARRLWLLYNALRHLPFDQAIERASAAEAFVTEFMSEEPPVELKGDSEPALAPLLGKTEIDIGEISQATHNVVPRLSKRPPLSLPDEQRDRLLQRFAEGAKNAELVSEFGLSLRQVQGIRMGSAREIAKRREQLSKTAPGRDATPSCSASADEVVRYLRQQDDIVVPSEDGQFLVNSRFRMSLAELVARANRMRHRQGRPAFELPGDDVVADPLPGANGHHAEVVPI